MFCGYNDYKMRFDKEYGSEDMMKNISYITRPEGVSKGSHNNPSLNFVSHGNYNAHPANMYLPELFRNILLRNYIIFE